jgi:aldehyde dehydrogenase (NAD+)
MGSCRIEQEPLGVALVISAWNYPIYTAIPLAAAAIAAGNCVILKPSELAPHSSGVIKKLFEKYLNPEFFQVIEGRVEVAKAVTRLPVDVICFTGSTMTGRLVAIEAAKNLVPCILELGGKCPVIVDETANLDSAINRILNGKFLNCGQTCIGVDHVYVH